ncbi:MAG TPA: hypothetical protein VFN95_11905, partial [Flavitalea sp.]|nr:hypothetical protein [Flavitalea sp.]
MKQSDRTNIKETIWLGQNICKGVSLRLHPQINSNNPGTLISQGIKKYITLVTNLQPYLRIGGER